MSATSSNEAVEGLSNQGEFRSRPAPAEPLDGPKHAPGILVGNDAVPEFHAEQHPAGTAPSKDTYTPNPVNETPVTQEQRDKDAPAPSAIDSLGGATSYDVDQGLGKPMQGQTGVEERHGGQHGRKHDKSGTDQFGSDTTLQTGRVPGQQSGGNAINTHLPEHQNQRALEKEEAQVGRGEQPSAEEREPVRAEDL